MKYSDYYRDYYYSIFKRIYVIKDAVDEPSVQRAVKKLDKLPLHIIESKDDIPESDLNSSTLFIKKRIGETVGKCPGTNRHICCNYVTVDLYEGCTLGCSYCIMKSYLNFAPITVYADSKPAIDRIKKLAEVNADRYVRVGTGEVGDSLQFDPLFEMSADFIRELSAYENVYFEAKTKTDFVDHLLDIENKGNAVISFSLNPADTVREEEVDAFSLENRLKAAEKAVSAGYNLAFHFDPMICENNWEKRYLEVAEKLSVFPKGKIKWISLGTFRYTPSLKDRMQDRPYLYNEFVPCLDGKYRYLQTERKKIYKKMHDKLKEVTDAPVYMCMESSTVWRKAFGRVPGETEDLKWIFRKVRGVEKHRH